MRVLITGTHLSPALTVAKEFKKQHHRILFIGRKQALEGDRALSLDYQAVTEEGFEFKNLLTGRLQRKWTKYTILSLLKIPVGFFQALLILINFRPNIILSFGGYISLPVTLTGFLLRIPVVVHEQTLGAGLSNKIASLWARKILISWENSRWFFPKEKTILTGNPVREEVFNSELSTLNSQLSTHNLPIIYITGGSLGSHVINLAIEKIISKLLEDFIVVHQTGDAREYRDFERLVALREKLVKKLKARYFLTKFIDSTNLGQVLNNANLVIGRAGISTVSELLALNKPGLLIPLPFAAGNEQMKNALFLKKEGLAEILPQSKLTPERLLNKIKEMTESIKRYKRKTFSEQEILLLRKAAGKIMEVILNEIKEGAKKTRR